MADDDIEKLLREVAASTGSTPPPAAKTPAKKGGDVEARGESGGRLAFAVGSMVVLGVITWGVGLFLPFVSAVSCGIGGAVAAFVTALIAGPPRWFSR